MRGETFAATDDGPATLDGRPIGASTKDKLTDFVVSMALSGRAARSAAPGPCARPSACPRSMGSAALALAYVGNGRFDAFVQQGGLSLWDVAAAGLIAERGGATVTDLAGGPGSRSRTKPRIDRHPRGPAGPSRGAASTLVGAKPGRNGN